MFGKTPNILKGSVTSDVIFFSFERFEWLQAAMRKKRR